MGAAAIQPPDQLRESGVENDRAESEAQAKTQFVTADEYHKRDKTLATRDDLKRGRWGGLPSGAWRDAFPSGAWERQGFGA